MPICASCKGMYIWVPQYALCFGLQDLLPPDEFSSEFDDFMDGLVEVRLQALCICTLLIVTLYHLLFIACQILRTR